jgi:hypothetical protein
MRPTEPGARQGMYRRATAVTHERHASVLVIHFIMRVSPCLSLNMSQRLSHSAHAGAQHGVGAGSGLNEAAGCTAVPEWTLGGCRGALT